MILVGRPTISWSKRVYLALICAGISYVVFLPDSIAQIDEPIEERPSNARSIDLALLLQPKLVYVSGDSTRGVAGQNVQEPLRVMVTDEFDQPVPDYKVRFSVIRGGGSIDDSLEVQRLTDIDGTVSVYPRLGTSVGWYTNVFTARAYGGTGQEITGSPIDFHISGRKSRAALMEYVSGDGQSARAEQTLPDPLQVRVRDDEGNALIGHDVTFRVFQGGGSLGSEKENSLTVATETGGIARAQFHLGPEIGINNHMVRASSDDGLEDLTGSPQLFYASAPYGQPDLNSSRVIVTNSPVIADNVAEAVILIRLMDTEQNPITGEQVTISVTGSDNIVIQPQNLTDQNGETTARVRSTRAERKIVTARITLLGLDLTDEPAVDFIAGPPYLLLDHSGNGQTANSNTALPEPLILQLFDQYDNPIPGYPVTARAGKNSGYIVQPQPVLTDSVGVVELNWVLGPLVGRQEISVTPQGMERFFVFFAIARIPSELSLVLIKGSEQYAAPGLRFADSLIVRVNDPYGNPVHGIDVNFSLLQGDAVFTSPATVATDENGRAGVLISAGVLPGAIKIRASIVDSIYVDFYCAVSMAPPEQILHLYGDALRRTVADTIELLAAKVVDRTQNPVANVPVSFSAMTPGGAVLTEQPVRTNNFGQASCRALLGEEAGSYIFTAANSTLKGSPVTFVIEAVPDSPENIYKLAGDGQTGIGLDTLEARLVVKVTDRFDNAVSDIPVLFTAISGGGQILTEQPVNSDSSGIVSCLWQLGTAGEQLVLVSSPDVPNASCTFTAQLRLNMPPIIEVVADTTVTIGDTLFFTVSASDPEGQTVTLGVENLPDGAYFDSLATGLFRWSPNLAQQGQHQVTFIARDQQGLESRKTVVIRVYRSNEMPYIVSYEPETEFLLVTEYEPIQFAVQAADPDDDTLYISWYRDQRLIGSGSTVRIIPNTILMPAQFDVKALISDKTDAVTLIWHVTIEPMAVRLDFFRADVKDGYVKLTWRLIETNDTACFHIKRSLAGREELITGEPVTESADGLFTFVDTPAVSGDCLYKIVKIEKNGRMSESEPINVTFSTPEKNGLRQNYPNPFNPVTHIRYQLSSDQDIAIDIINMRGQRIRSLFRGRMSSGYHTIIWDGRDDSNLAVPSGVYHCILRGESFQSSIKIALLK